MDTMRSRLTLSERIHMARRRSGLRQDEIAARCGVSRQLVSKWERGDSIPDLIETLKLADVMGIPLDWFTVDLLDVTGSEQGSDVTRCFRAHPDDLRLFDDEGHLLPESSDPLTAQSLVIDLTADPVRVTRRIDAQPRQAA